MNCVHCNGINRVEYNKKTTCIICFIRFKRTGSFTVIAKPCQTCDKQLRSCNKSGFCEACRRVACKDELYKKQRARVLSRIDQEKEYQKKYREANKDKMKQYKIEYYKINTETLSKISREKYQANPEKYKLKTKLWNKNNRRKRYISNKLREERKKSIFVDLYKKEIEQFYLNCPENCTVDHILPLNGKNVSGFHVPWNLQYLENTLNFKKSRKFDGTYENKSWEKEV